MKTNYGIVLLWMAIVGILLICSVQGRKIGELKKRCDKLELENAVRIDVGTLELTDGEGNIRYIMNRGELIDLIDVQSSLLRNNVIEKKKDEKKEEDDGK